MRHAAYIHGTLPWCFPAFIENLLSPSLAVSRVLQIWDATTGAAYTSIEPPEGADINDVCLWPGSGLMLLGLDASRIGSYFVPSLGPAPRWASFLEGLTEELEESSPTLYDDYR